MVSVLDLDNIAFRTGPQGARSKALPYSEDPAILMLYLSIRCQSPSDWTAKYGAKPVLGGQIVSPGFRVAHLVGRGGLEPPTSRLSGVRSNHLSYRPTCRSGSAGQTAPVERFEACAEGASPRRAQHPMRNTRCASPGRAQLSVRPSFGGAYRDRTDDPLLAKQMLSQLS